uniref:Putative LOV domain-containing protein n=1 Tax=Mesostigma viride TaxID=41882 RepID=A0A126WZE8_MESVI|nr:putative LOV domain-containing protein [Mesostigma viride]
MKIQQSFVLSDPNLPDCPIVYASDRFCHLSGYPRHEVENRNCRFLQGPQTDPRTVETIRTAVAEGRPCTVRLLNYRKDGTPFWNSLHVSPVRNAEGKITYFVGVQLDVSEAVNVPPAEASKDTVPAAKTVSASFAQVGAGEADGAPVPCPAAEFVNNNARVLQLGAAGAVKVAVRGLQSATLHRRMADGSSACSTPSPSLQ